MRKVSWAKLHAPYFLVGVGHLTDTLGDPQKHKGMELNWAPEGLHCSWEGHEFFIPAANMVGCTFAPSEAPRVFIPASSGIINAHKANGKATT